MIILPAYGEVICVGLDGTNVTLVDRARLASKSGERVVCLFVEFVAHLFTCLSLRTNSPS